MASDVRGQPCPDAGSPSSAASGLEKLLAASGMSTTLELAPSSLFRVGSGMASRVATDSPLVLSPPVSASLQARITSLSANPGVASLPADSQSILALLARASTTSNLPPLYNQLGASSVTTIVNPLTNLLSNAGFVSEQYRSTADLSKRLNPAAMASSSGAPVRKEQIEAALRSKPQRGRKRENLNEYERMELTRTRNREHAKSTRIRKKARYEELLDFEEKWKEHLRCKELNDKRKSIIHAFVLQLEHRLRTKFDSGASQNRSTQPLTSFEDIMDESATFLYDGQRKVQNEFGWREEMEAFYDWLVGRVASYLGQAVIPMLTTSIQGGSDQGIALNELHSGFAKVDMTVASLSVMQALVRFEFALSSEYSKLTVVQWCTLLDASETGCFGEIPAVRHVQRTSSSSVSQTIPRFSSARAVVSAQHGSGSSNASEVSISRGESSGRS